MPSLTNQVKAIANGNFMSCIGNFIHRDIYQNYQFDTTRELSGGEDWEFWIRVLADYKVGRIEKINSGILDHGGRSVNNQNLGTMQLGLQHVCAKLASDPHLSEVYGPHLKRIRASSLVYLAILANTGAMFGEARRFLMEAARIDPGLLAKPRFWRVARRAWLRLQPI
jgi:hypothetical protein